MTMPFFQTNPFYHSFYSPSSLGVTSGISKNAAQMIASVQAAAARSGLSINVGVRGGITGPTSDLSNLRIYAPGRKPMKLMTNMFDDDVANTLLKGRKISREHVAGFSTMGSTIYVGPGRRVSEGGKIESFMDSYTNEIRTALSSGSVDSIHSINKKFTSLFTDKAQGDVSMLFDTSGPRIMPAIYASHSIDINNLSVMVGGTQQRYGDVAAAIRSKELGLSSSYKNDRKNLESLFHSRDELMRATTLALRNQGINASPLMTREGKLFSGVISTLGAEDIGFSLQMEGLAKGESVKRMNVQMIRSDLAEKEFGASVFPVVAGKRFGEFVQAGNVVGESVGSLGKFEKINRKTGTAGIKTRRGIQAIQAKTFLALGEVGKSGDIGAVSGLGDSSSFFSERLFRVTRQSLEENARFSASEMGGAKHIKLSNPAIQDAALRPELKAIYEAASKGEKNVLIGKKKYTINYHAKGRFTLGEPLELRATQHLGYDSSGKVIPVTNKKGKPVNYGVFLGTSAPPEGIPHTAQDISRNTVIVKDARAISFRGGSILEDGKIGLDVSPVGPYRQTVPSLVEGRATLAQSAEALLESVSITGKKTGVDVLMRGEDLGLSISGKGIKASEKFVTGGYLRSIADKAREAGKLEQLGKFLDLGHQKGETFSVSSGGSTVRTAFAEYLYKDNMTKLTGQNLVDVITRLHSASATDLANMGLGSKDAQHLVGLLKPVKDSAGNITYQIGKEYIEDLTHKGRTYKGVSGIVQEIALRQISNPKDLEAGSLKIRLDNYGRHVEQQVSVFRAAGKAGLADDLNKFKQMLLESKSAGYKRNKIISGSDLSKIYTKGYKPGMRSQVASILSMTTSEKKIGGVLGSMGAGMMETISINQMLADEYERPIANTAAKASALMEGGLKLTDLPGKVDPDLGRNVNRGGFFLDLGFDVVVPIGEGKQVTTSKIAMPTLDVLGVQPEGMSMYMGASIREGSLGRRAEMIKASLAETQTTAALLGKNISEVVSEDLRKEIGAFQSDLLSAMTGKGGFLGRATTVAPKGGISTAKVTHMALTDSMDNALTINLNEKDFFSALKKARGDKYAADYKKAYKAGAPVEDIFAMLHRDPVHSRENLLSVRLVIDKDIKERGTVKVTDVLKRLFGDFDNDSVSKIIASGNSASEINSGLKRIHEEQMKHYKDFLEVYKRIDDKNVKDIFDNLGKSGFIEAKVSADDFVTKALQETGETTINQTVLDRATELALKQRFAGAAGEAALTKQADKMAKMTADLILAHGGGEGLLSEANRELLPFMEAAGLDEAAGIFREFGKSGRAKDLLAITGSLQEGLVYASLKKVEKGGLGMIDPTSGELRLTFGEAMANYATDKSEKSLELVKRTFVEGYGRSFTEGALGTQAFGTHLAALNIDAATYEAATKAGTLRSVVETKLSDVFESNKSVFSAIADVLNAPDAYNQGLLTRILGRYHHESAGATFDAAVESGAATRSMIGAAMDKATEMTPEGKEVMALKKVNAGNLAEENEAIKRAAAAGGESTLEKAGSLFKDLMGSEGFKKGALIAGGVMGGMAIFDSLFEEDEQPAPPIYSNAGAPLPPAASIQMPDSSASIPQGFAFPSNPRVERPYAMRQVYNVSGSGADAVDFGGIMSAGSAGVNVQPSRTVNIRDSRQRMSDRNLPYQVREKLNSSF